MEIVRTITNVWTLTIGEKEVLDRFNDESIQESERLAASKAQGLTASDNDRALMHRYYCSALAELSAVLARRTTRVGGSIVNNTDPDTHMLTTVYTLPMTDNHESELVDAFGANCLEFLVARTMERWYGHGIDLGSSAFKDEVRHILQYRRFPIERPIRPL